MEVRNFRDWFKQQPAKYKIVVAGNHEETFDETHEKYYFRAKELITNDKEIIYLENQSVVIDGVKFYGTPWTPYFYGWGFNGIVDGDMPFRCNGTRPLREVYSNIPEDTNVLICHGPPYDLVDRNAEDGRCGSVEMRRVVEQMMFLRLYLCGHIHEARGHDQSGGTHFINASTLARDYETARPPVIIDLDEDGFVDNVQGLEEE